VVISVSSTATTQLVGQLGQLTLLDNPTNTTLVTNATTLPAQSFEVNSVQTTAPKTSQQSREKKRNNNNRPKKNSSTEPTRPTNQEYNVGGNHSRRKFKYPHVVCQEDHMTKYCPHLPDVHNYVKQGQPSSQPVVLTNPFPAP
jgi:hypothetical protein